MIMNISLQSISDWKVSSSLKITILKGILFRTFGTSGSVENQWNVLKLGTFSRNHVAEGVPVSEIACGYFVTRYGDVMLISKLCLLICGLKRYLRFDFDKIQSCTTLAIWFLISVPNFTNILPLLTHPDVPRVQSWKTIKFAYLWSTYHLFYWK